MDIEKCTENAGGNRFEMVVMAAIRAREISKAHRSAGRTDHINSTMNALFDFQDGKIDREYLKRVK